MPLPAGFELVIDQQNQPKVPEGFVMDTGVAKPVQKPLSWADVPGQMVRNLPSSAGNFIGGVYQTVRHPIDTLSTLGDVATGAIQKVRNLSPEGSRGSAPAFDTSTFDAAKKFFVDRFGSEEGFKKALATDPVGIAGDLSLLLTGGAAVAPKAGGIAAGLKTAANVTNPMTGLIEGLKAVGPTSGLVATQGLGMATGVGAENIATAFKAGKEGTIAFMENMAGRVAKTDVLDQARQALANMRATRSTDYRTNIATTAADTTPLNFGEIDTALQKVKGSLQQGGHSKIGAAETAKVDEVAAIIKEWRDDPSAHTAPGLDALKQRLDAVYPESPTHNQSRRVIKSIRTAVYDTIVKQSPEYASTMKAYEEAISLEQEIERALNLGQKASADTALRKLTSLGRNNVNTNYGYRLDLAKALEQQGGKDLMPAIAGQTMSSWTPRGLTGQLGAPATAGAALMGSPAMALALPFMSPRLVGEGAYRTGQLAKVIQPVSDKAAELISKIPMTQQQMKLAALLAAQSANANRQPNK